MAHTTSCPYVGLQPYTEEDRQFFFGREPEQRIISSNLYASSLTVVYGASGVGKSSILRAGVVPYLRSAERTTVVYFNQWQDPCFADRLKADCLQAVVRSLGSPVTVDTSKPLHKFLADLGKKSGSALLILLDQFEEYFLYHPETDSASNFDGEFASAVNQNQTELGFTISLRDDWLSRLDRFQRRIPNLLSNTYRLDHLTSAAAGDAIRKPLEVYNRANSKGAVVQLEDELVPEVLAQVRAGELNLSESQGSGQAKGTENGDRIETAFLQLVMTRLWHEEMKAGSGRLRVGTLRQLGGARQIVQSHLDNVLGTLSRPQQQICAGMFRYLVTPRGSKVAHETVDLIAFAERPVEEVKPLLEKLADPSTHLLRRTSPPERYEIFHDVLGPAVLDWRTRYTKEQEKAELAKQAEAEAQRKSAKRMRRLSVGLAVAGILALVLGGLSAHKAKLATRAERERAAAVFAASQADERESNAKLLLGELQKLKAQSEAKEAKRDAKTAADQANIAVAHQLGAEALVALADGNHETNLLLAWEATRITFDRDGTVLPDVEEALRRSTAAPPKELERTGHSKPVTTLAFSPNGNLLITSGTDDTVRIWDISSSEISSRPEIALFKGTQCTASPGIVFSNNGDSIACGSHGELRVWDANTHKQILPAGTSPGTAGPQSSGFQVQQIALAADGRTVFAGCSDHNIRSWDLSGKTDTFPGREPVIIESGRRIAYLTDKSINLRDLATGEEQTIEVPSPSTLVASADGNHLAARSVTNGSVTIWDSRSLHSTESFTDRSAQLIAISPDGSRAATYSGTLVKVWDWTSPNPPSTSLLPIPSAPRLFLPSLFFSPDGKTLVLRPGLSPNTDPNKAQETQFWDVTSGRPTGPAPSGWIAVAFNQDGSRLALVSQSSLKIQELKSHRRSLRTIYDHGDGYTFMMAAFSPDAKLVAAVTQDDAVHLWDVRTDIYLQYLGHHSDTVQDIQFSPDGKFLATASDDGFAKVWDIDTRKERFELIPEPGPDGHATGNVLSAVFSRDSKFLATGSTHCVKIWNMRSDNPSIDVKSVTPKNAGSIGDVAFSPDGRRLVIIGHEGKQMELWDVSSAQPKFIEEQPKPAKLSYSVAFTADGKHLVAPGMEGMMVWDLATKRWRSLPGALTGDNWLGMAISPDQKTVAGSGTGGTVILWNLDLNKEQTTLYTGKKVLKALAYSPDGNTLYTLAEDWKMYEHLAPLQLVLREAQERLAKGKGPKQLDEKTCLAFLRGPCPPEVLELNKKKTAPSGKAGN